MANDNDKSGKVIPIKSRMGAPQKRGGDARGNADDDKQQSMRCCKFCAHVKWAVAAAGNPGMKAGDVFPICTRFPPIDWSVSESMAIFPRVTEETSCGEFALANITMEIMGEDNDAG